MTEQSWSCCFPFTLWFAGLLGWTLGQRGCFLASLAEAARVQVTSKAAGSFQTLQITLAPSEAPAWSLCPRPRSSQVKVVCDISTASFTDRLSIRCLNWERCWRAAPDCCGKSVEQSQAQKKKVLFNVRDIRLSNHYSSQQLLVAARERRWRSATSWHASPSAATS